ncbi:MAG: helix-turn-helix domain-containing protein [Firmicutes bacterium]|nr:helix-turn-helix domain-containing protein [Bacillota bacterium]
MNIIKNFSERLKELIFDNRINVKILSKAIACSENTVYDWLTGTVSFMPSVSNLIKLADYFKCSIDFLIGIEEENYLPNPKPCPPFSAWFRNAIEVKGFTLYSLGKKVEMTTSNFYSWINQKNKPNLDSLLRIAAALDCTIDYLVGRE